MACDDQDLKRPQSQNMFPNQHSRGSTEALLFSKKRDLASLCQHLHANDMGYKQQHL